MAVDLKNARIAPLLRLWLWGSCRVTQLVNASSFFCLALLLLATSCDKETSPLPDLDEVSDFFPLKEGNYWTYTREGINEEGQITSADTEQWRVNSQLFVDFYGITADGEEHLGYKVFYPNNRVQTDDLIGTFISVAYLDLPTDSLVLVASDSINFLRERWIEGGLTQLTTAFGELECICTKTRYHLSTGIEEDKLYFCRDTGIALMEKNYLSQDDEGNSRVSFTWRRTLSSYQVD